MRISVPEPHRILSEARLWFVSLISMVTASAGIPRSVKAPVIFLIIFGLFSAGMGQESIVTIGIVSPREEGGRGLCGFWGD